MNWKLFKYSIWIFFSLLIIYVNFPYADTLGQRLPSYVSLDLLSSDLDADGYNLTNVGGITGNSTYIGFGGEVTSNALTGSGSIVFDKGEANGNFYVDGLLYCASNVYGLDLFSLRGASLRYQNNNLRIALNDSSTYEKNLLLVNQTNQNDDYGHSDPVNPTYIIHSSTPSSHATDQWMSFTHDQTDAVIDSGKGSVKIDTHTVVTGDLTVGGDIVLKNGVEIVNHAGDYLQFEDSNGYDCDFQFNTNYVALNCDRAELRLRAANGGIVSIYDGNATPTLQFNPTVTTTNAYIQVKDVSGPPNPSPNLVLRNLDTGDIEILADANTDVLIGDGGTDDVKIANNGVLSFVGTARMSFQSKTEAELKALSCAGFAEGTPYWDSTNKAVVTSTGTSTGSFGLITDGTSLPTGW